MKIIEYLNNRLNELTAEKTTLSERANSATTADEVRQLTEQRDKLNKQIDEVSLQIKTIENENASRGILPDGTIKPLETFKTEPAKTENTRSDEPYTASMEYRKAFKDYVQRGVVNMEVLKRASADGTFTIADDVKMLIPETVMREMIRNYRGIYGTIYNKVRKMNIKGGVKFPIGDFSATMSWINEETQSKRQPVGEAKTFIEFGYYMAEIRVSNSLLSSIVTIDQFENEIADVIVRAWLKEIDTVILKGDGSGKPLGILNDTRVADDHKITLTEAQFKSWKAWKTELFAKIPLGLRGGGEFIFPVSTVETHLATMSDDVNRPLFREATDLTVGGENGSTSGRFFGRNVQYVEPDLIPDYDTAKAGDVIGVLWNPNDYAINTNMQWHVRRYFDEETNNYVSKALVILDGKLVDPKNCYLLIKG